MKYAAIGLVIAVALLGGMVWLFTRSTVVEEKRIILSGGVILSYRVISEGGALGQTRYEVFAEQQGKRVRIFEGLNGARFRISHPDPGLILIRFCDGRVDYIAPVPVAANRPPILVQSDLHCVKAQ
ncbi:hypothetical protein Swit_4438 [Rhizorhabdus wittichii RW1]|uniref:Uncharacterized protein n=1 Tax=Rhizorhabdus wittichii (strain DSM 6014 / CCUG 31198 / JCM 15750 / NBRC 105917 / EY 4224 / RW1) TaxID=392499 RepID=A0A9J9LGP1_RHIWR|nr:hypothetical protein Swit_4438 [Rhizorhabdus wittichii RW1]